MTKNRGRISETETISEAEVLRVTDKSYIRKWIKTHYLNAYENDYYLHRFFENGPKRTDNNTEKKEVPKPVTKAKNKNPVEQVSETVRRAVSGTGKRDHRAIACKISDYIDSLGYKEIHLDFFRAITGAWQEVTGFGITPFDEGDIVYLLKTKIIS